MPQSELERIFAALEASRARYLVVGSAALRSRVEAAPRGAARRALGRRCRESQRRAWLRLSYAERLRWLEQAKRFATLVLEAARERKKGGSRA